MSSARTCSECRQALPEGAPEVLCPACALRSVADGVVEVEPEVQPAEPGGRKSEVSGQSSVVSPRAFADYELLEEIARGGMGVVYRARQQSLNRIVALKMIVGGPLASAAAIQRFRAEAQTVASLQHPNIVAIHEIGEHEGQPFFSMDFVKGQNLAGLVRDGPLPARRAAGYVKVIAEAVDYAHQRGILHRDLKPSNVLIDSFDQPRITDFGLAKRLENAEPGTRNAELTLTGQVLGSPNFMAPEQAQGRPREVGPASDVYSIGAMLYHLVTGRPPFQAATLTEVLQQVVTTEPAAPRLLNPGVPRDLETICLKCLEKEVQRRYPTAQELAEDLDRFLQDQPIRARPASAVGKAWKWCRRQPVRAGLIGALALVFILGLTGVLSQWRRAESQRVRAEAGELIARQNTYAADMKEVQRALEDSDLGRARELLNRHRPSASDKWRVISDEQETPELGKFDSRASSLATGQWPLVTDLRGWEWRYFWSRCQTDERFTLCQYANAVSALAFSPDGKWLAVRQEGGAVALWDAVAKRPRVELPGHDRGLCKALAFSPRGNLLAWGSQDGSGKPVVSLRDLSAQQDIAAFSHSNTVVSVAFSPDAQAMATLATDGTVRVWDVESQQVTSRFPSVPVGGEVEESSTAAKVKAASATDGTVGRTGLGSKQARTQFPTSWMYTDHYGCVLFSPDGRWLAVAAAKPRIRLLDRATGKETVKPVPPPADGITALAFSPDSKLLAAGCGAGDNEVHVWDLAADTEERLAGHSGWIASLAFSPDGQTLASTSGDQAIRLWDLTGKAEPRRFQGDTNEVWAIAWSPDGRDLVTGAKDGSVRYWDPAARPAAAYDVLREPIEFWGPAFFPDSKTFLAPTKSEGAVVRWDAATLQEVEKLSFLGTNHFSLALSGDARWLALGDTNGNIRVWDLPARKLVTNLFIPESRVFALFFSSRGNFLLGGAWPWDSGTIGKYWAVAGWGEMPARGIDLKSLFEADISPDERTLAIGYANGTVAWWNLATGKRQAWPDCRYSSLVHVAFSPDGRLFATAGLDSLVTVWDVATRHSKPIGRGYRHALHDLAFSPDGRRLITSGTSAKDVITLWDVATGRDVATLPGEPGWFARLGFSPDGNTLFAASPEPEGTALFWHAPSWAEIQTKEKKERAQ